MPGLPGPPYLQRRRPQGPASSRLQFREVDDFSEGAGNAGGNYTNATGISSGGATGAGSSWVYDTTFLAGFSPMGSRLDVTTNAVNRFVTIKGAGAGAPIGFFIVGQSFSDLPTATALLANWRLNGVSQGDIRLTTTGTIQLRDSGTARYTTTTAITLGQLYYYEVHVDVIAQHMILRLRDVTGTLLEQSTVAPYTAGGVFNEWNVGYLANPGLTTHGYIDYWGYSTFDWVGPPPWLGAAPKPVPRRRTAATTRAPGRGSSVAAGSLLQMPVLPPAGQIGPRRAHQAAARHPSAPQLPPPPASTASPTWIGQPPTRRTRLIPVERARSAQPMPVQPTIVPPIQAQPRRRAVLPWRRRGTAAALPVALAQQTPQIPARRPRLALRRRPTLAALPAATAPTLPPFSRRRFVAAFLRRPAQAAVPVPPVAAATPTLIAPPRPRRFALLPARRPRVAPVMPVKVPAPMTGDQPRRRILWPLPRRRPTVAAPTQPPSIPPPPAPRRPADPLPRRRTPVPQPLPAPVVAAAVPPRAVTVRRTAKRAARRFITGIGPWLAAAATAQPGYMGPGTAVAPQISPTNVGQAQMWGTG